MKLEEQGFEESNAYSLCLYAFRSQITKDFFGINITVETSEPKFKMVILVSIIILHRPMVITIIPSKVTIVVYIM